MSLAYLQCIEESCRHRKDPKKESHSCSLCGGLLEVSYEFDPFDPEELREVWHQRRLSGEPIDRSGVWRFPELIPFFGSGARVISLSQGSAPPGGKRRPGGVAVPLYLSAKHPRQKPSRSFLE